MMWGRDAYWEYVSRPYAFNVRRPGEHRGEEESFSAWALADRQQPLDRKPALVGWVPTDDPNAGKVPSDVFENVDPQTGYLSPFDWDTEDFAWFEWGKAADCGGYSPGRHSFLCAEPAGWSDGSLY